MQTATVDARDTRNAGFVSYVWWSTAATVFLYGAGYATIGFGLLFFGTIWRLLSRRSFPWRPTPLDLPLAVFGAVLLVSALVSPYRPVALVVTPMLLLSGGVYYGSFAWLLDRMPGARIVLMRLWALGAVPAALAGIVVMRVMNAHANPDDYTRALIPHGVGPNGLGTTLLIGSLMALGLSVIAGATRWERGLWLACSAVSFVGLLATESRASAAGWMAGAALLLGDLGWRALQPRARAAAMVAAAALVVGLMMGGTLSGRTPDLIKGHIVSSAQRIDPSLLTRVFNFTNDLAANRLRIWGTSLRMVAALPYLGTGFGTFGAAYARWSPETSHEPFAFNLALNLAVEAGLLGLYAAAWVAVAAVAEWRRLGLGPATAGDATRPVIAAVWIGLLIDQMFDNTLFSISTSAALWLLLAFLVVPAGRSLGAARNPGCRAGAGEHRGLGIIKCLLVMHARRADRAPRNRSDG